MRDAPPDAPRALTPIRGLIKLAKRAGYSHVVADVLTRFVTSEMFMKRGFKGYVPTKRDVFAATFAKSGTNWMMQIAHQIAHRGHGEFEHIHDVVPWPDAPDSRCVAIDDPRTWESSPTGLRVIKTHADATWVPYSPDATYLVVLRDPKEVLVSAYFFAGALFGVGDTLSPKAWKDTVFASQRGIFKRENPWLTHTLSWWALRDKPNVLVLTFQEMKADLEGSVRKVAKVMGVDLSDDEVAEVVRRSTVKYMKAEGHRFSPKPLPFAEPTHMPEMVRRGAAGGADELYSAEDLAEVDAQILADLERLGSDFPYQALFGASA